MRGDAAVRESSQHAGAHSILQRASGSLGLGSRQLWAVRYRYREWNSGPLKKQQVFLTADPAHIKALLKTGIYWIVGSCCS